MFSLSLILLSSNTIAMSDKLTKDELIDKVIAAYGGDKLLQLSDLTVSDKYKVFTLDQGPDPSFNGVTILYSELFIDFDSDKKLIKNWRQDHNGNQLRGTLFDGKSGWNINYLRASHVKNSSVSTNTVGAGMMKMIDTVLVRRLAENRDSAQIVSRKNRLGQPVYTLTFTSNDNNQYAVEIDAPRGLLLSMLLGESRNTGRFYKFSQHKKQNGVTFAHNMDMFTAGEPRFVTTSRKVKVNKLNAQTFALPKASKQLQGLTNNSMMTVKQLADGVYIVGEQTRFSIFVDVGDHYVGAGGLRGIDKRLSALNKHLNKQNQIKVQIIPDHHRGHLGALSELAEMNTGILIAPTHRKIVETIYKNNNKIDEVSNMISLVDGKVEVYNIHTAHADNYLLFYLPAEKLVFSADHFGTSLINALPGANNTIKSFHSEINRLGISVSRYANAHSARVLSQSDLKMVLSDYKIQPCPLTHAFCQN